MFKSIKTIKFPPTDTFLLQGIWVNNINTEPTLQNLHHYLTVSFLISLQSIAVMTGPALVRDVNEFVTILHWLELSIQHAVIDFKLFGLVQLLVAFKYTKCMNKIPRD